LNIPAVTTVHGSSKQKGLMPLYEWFQERVWFRRFDAVVAVSQPLFTTLQRYGVPARRLHLIPNAWEASAEFVSRSEAREAMGLPADALCVGWVGRFIQAKGADVMLEAAARLADRAIVVSLVGDGPERAALERQSRALGLADRVRFHGTVDVAARYLLAFDTLVLSSRTEGTPVVLLEGMAAGVPLVATTVGGIPYTVTADEATLVAPEDPAALAHGIARTLSDPTEAVQRSTRAQERVAREFGVDRWLEQYEHVYRSVV